MKTEDFVEIFLAGRLQMDDIEETEKLKQIIASLSSECTISNLLPVLEELDNSLVLALLFKIARESTVAQSSLFNPILINLNKATPASDSKDVLL